MHPKTEEFLNLLLWSADMLSRPTFRNLTDSYESWAYRNGLMRQAAFLERGQLVERDPSAPDDRMYRLTWQGTKICTHCQSFESCSSFTQSGTDGDKIGQPVRRLMRGPADAAQEQQSE